MAFSYIVEVDGDRVLLEWEDVLASAYAVDDVEVLGPAPARWDRDEWGSSPEAQANLVRALDLLGG